MVPPHIMPGPMIRPYNMIPTLNYDPPQPQFNQMNNYKNKNDEELPSMEEIESIKTIIITNIIDEILNFHLFHFCCNKNLIANTHILKNLLVLKFGF